MKTLIFANGTEISFVECYGTTQYVQGAQRDVLDFRFDASTTTMDAIDALFTSENCMNITIKETTETEGHTAEYIHKNYGLRVALSKQVYTLATENGTEDKEQISVKMGQLTYTEMQVASLTDTVDILVMESLMG